MKKITYTRFVSLKKGDQVFIRLGNVYITATAEDSASNRKIKTDKGVYAKEDVYIN